LQIDSADQKLLKIQYTVCGNFSQGAGTSGTGSDIAFSQLAVKGLIIKKKENVMNINFWGTKLFLFSFFLSFFFFFC
jgi:hypothetical protein